MRYSENSHFLDTTLKMFFCNCTYVLFSIFCQQWRSDSQSRNSWDSPLVALHQNYREWRFSLQLTPDNLTVLVPINRFKPVLTQRAPKPTKSKNSSPITLHLLFPCLSTLDYCNSNTLSISFCISFFCFKFESSA